MPVIDLTLPEGCFERAEHEALAAELTRLIIHWAGGSGRPGHDTASWAFVQDAELAEVGGRPRRPDRRQVYRVVVSVPKGSLDAARRSGLMHDVARAVIAAEGSEPTTENLMRVRCAVDEIPDGSWDVGPGPLRLRDLAALFGAARDDQRCDGSRRRENRCDRRKGRARASRP
jgi:phenylpyruvate tautomerase PptA (4-oxalocrotonate tautomerase family)